MWGSTTIHLLTKLSFGLLATQQQRPQRAPNTYSPESTQQIANDFRSQFAKLGNDGGGGGGGHVEGNSSSSSSSTSTSMPVDVGVGFDADVAVSKQYLNSKTVKFTYVPPPPPPVYRYDGEEEEENNHEEKPIALYLPGLDGVGTSAMVQYDDLSKTFELWRMVVTSDDRTTFHNLVQQPVHFIRDVVEGGNNKNKNSNSTRTATRRRRPLYLIGESFGGMLASAVALQVNNNNNNNKNATTTTTTENDNNNNNTNIVVDGMVLVNPGTSFDSSNWDVLAPMLTTIGKLTESSSSSSSSFSSSLFGLSSPPSLYSVLGGFTLAATIPSSKQYKRIVETFFNIDTTTLDPTKIVETINGYIDLLTMTSELLPPDLVNHRITNWMMTGSQVLIESRLQTIQIPTLIVVGEKDNLLHSKDEATRLTKLLPTSQKLVVKDAGHLVLDETVNLTEAILYSILDPFNIKEKQQKEEEEKNKKYDPIVDWKMPPRKVVEESLTTNVKQLEERFSPIWMSTDQHGKRAFGIGNLPKTTTKLSHKSDNNNNNNNKDQTSATSSSSSEQQQQQQEPPILFVSNHQLLGQDVSLLLGKLIKNGITVRGLAHPVIFQGEGGNGGGGGSFGGGNNKNLGIDKDLGRVPGLEETNTTNNNNNNRGRGLLGGNNGNSISDFQKFGAVRVTPKNYYRLLQTGQNALLFPGGVREVFHGKNERYQLFWPETPKTDFVRTAARFNATIVPVSCVGMAESYRYLLDAKDVVNVPYFGKRIQNFTNNVTAARFDAHTNSDELFVPPLVVPSPPSRNYFVFGTPLSTVHIDPKNKHDCQQLYQSVQDEMYEGFEDILRARKKDPFRDAGPRLLYERITGQQAPTFPIEEVNK